jgi:hypothetical protein
VYGSAVFVISAVIDALDHHFVALYAVLCLIIVQPFHMTYACRMRLQCLLQLIPVEGRENFVSIYGKQQVVGGASCGEVSGGGKVVTPDKFMHMLRVSLGCFDGVVFGAGVNDNDLKRIWF